MDSQIKHLFKDKMKEQEDHKAIILKKPSGTITITGGNLSLIQKKTYNMLLYAVQESLYKDINADVWHKIWLTDIKEGLKLKKNDKENKNSTFIKYNIRKINRIRLEYNLLNKDRRIEGYAHLLDNIKFDISRETGNGYLKYTIPMDVRDAMIARIQGKNNALYANIDLKIIKGLQSKYSITLYELAKDYEKVEIPEMSINKFRGIFGLGTGKKKKYKRMVNLRKRVLDVACDEINESANIPFSIQYNLDKIGVVYTSIKFFVKKKRKKQNEIPTSDKQIDDKVIKNKDLQQLIELLPTKLQAKTKIISIVYASLKKNGKDYTRAQIKYFNAEYEKGKIQKPASYLSAAIKNDYAEAEISKAVIGIKAEQKDAKKAQQRAKEKEEAEKRQREEEEEKRIEDYYQNLSENQQNQIKNEALIRLHEKFPDAPATSSKFRNLSVEIVTKKIINERLRLNVAEIEEENTKKRAAEEKERRWEKKWEQLPDEQKDEYIFRAAEKSSWLKRILIRGEKDKHEDMVRDLAIAEMKAEMGSDQ